MPNQITPPDSPGPDDFQVCPYCTAIFGVEGIERVEYVTHVEWCASNLNPKNQPKD